MIVRLKLTNQSFSLNLSDFTEVKQNTENYIVIITL